VTRQPEVAMVLAAGYGRRMEPLSDVLPKPALPILDRPLVASAMTQAVATGARRVVVNLHHLPDAMASAARAAARSLGVELELSVEPELMDTAGGIALARDRGLLSGDGPLLVVNGDVLVHLDLDPLLARHATGDSVTMALLPHLDPRRWSRVVLDDAGRVAELRCAGQPAPDEVPLLYPGVMLISREAVNDIPTEPCDALAALWEPARAARTLAGAVVSGHWREVGEPMHYLNAVLDALEGQPWVHPSAQVAAGAAVGTAMIGRDAVIEPGAVVAESVVAEGAVVRSSARVVRSVLLGAVEASEDERVVGAFRTTVR
jgi:NDP-sugar pyrophosphorylase family protein